jgi:hypothetical protein
MFIVKTVPGLEGFSTEQNPVNWEGLKSRNFSLAFGLLKTPIYRISERQAGEFQRLAAPDVC